MKRHEYIKKHAAELYRLCEKRSKLSKNYLDGDHTPKRKQAMNNDLNWLGMQIAQEEERLAFALGKLLPENAQSEYRPSSFHRYEGIRKELETTKFEL